MDVKGVEHAVAIDDEDLFKEESHGEKLVCQIVDKFTDVNNNIDVLTMFLEELHASEIRHEFISKFSHGMVEGKDWSELQLLANKGKRFGERFDDPHVFLKPIC